MLKVVVGVFATAVVGLGGYTSYQYLSGNLSSPETSCCASKPVSCCDSMEQETATPSCCASMSRVSMSPCGEGKGKCCMDSEGDFSAEVLNIMPREVK